MAAFVKPLTVISATTGAIALEVMAVFRVINKGAFVSHLSSLIRLAEVYTEARATRVRGGGATWASVFAPIRKLAKYSKSFISV
jgi:hypothetical protein